MDQALKKATADHQSVSKQFQELQESVAKEREVLAGLEAQIKERNQEIQQLEQSKLEVSTGLQQLYTKRETLSDKVEELEEKHRELTRLCDALSDTEAKLAEVTAQLQSQTEERDRLTEELSHLSTQREDLLVSLEELKQNEESLQQRLNTLAHDELALKGSLEQLREQEKMDRARFEEMRNLVREAEEEKNRQVELLERDLAIKQREMMEIEDKFASLLTWKNVLDQRLMQFHELPEMSDEARALYEQLSEDQRKAGSRDVFSMLNGNGPSSYQNGPVLRSHARQLEAKIRRDEDRLGILRNRVEQLESEEQEKLEKVAALERRLAELQQQVERKHDVYPELHEENENEYSQNSNRSILGTLIDGARTKLKPIQPRPSASSEG